MEDFGEQYDPAFDPSFFHGIETDDPLADDASELDPIPSQLSFPKAHAHPPASDASVSSAALVSLNKELRAVSAPNPKFEAFHPHRIFETANWLVAYGAPTLEAFRTTDEIARRYFFEDLRKSEKLTFSQLAFLFKLARRIPPPRRPFWIFCFKTLKLDQKVSEKI